ncbi:RNA polymerase sigma factor [Halalkalibacter akibai]|uniref:RNA polymerase sigma factor n=1 Tax=Halalkalibacter akibai (strain ATCC 43226 / DSM 21942 / CIP 109018 / JCM 9157 / 1139) TaxID=1236973 RepID=W4R078_HALA3|nr:sigma-70 family RNA polymerase sigma factor [Halalkalibacter akibai]GAE37557.1 RNA polymerase sigma-70 factor [Halalkalibacter akibai JCM 9157]
MKDADSINERIEQIYDKHYKDVYHFLICFTGSRNDAEDLTQEVFIRVLKSLSSFNNQDRLKSWILAISRNVAVDYYRRNKFYSLFKDGFFNSLISNEKKPDQALEIAEEIEIVKRTILTLKPSYREVIILRGINEMSIKETAKILNCSESKVKVNYHRALKKLQTKLSFNMEEVIENAK